MSSRNGIKWSREETILAFDLYCRTSFGKISQSNRDIIELAILLERTPGSVGLKMHNLAHYDPELIKRNISAMSHGSKLDGEIWREFSQNWEELSYQAQKILAIKKNRQIRDIVDIGDIDNIPEGIYREKLTKTRVGQYFFRMAVLNSYGNKCCITGIEKAELLVASHIKPWKDSDEKTERTNPMNGLSLNALHDKAFDKGLITINSEYKIIISDKIKNSEMDINTRDWFISYDHKQILLPEKFMPDRQFIEYHNDVIFQH